MLHLKPNQPDAKPEMLLKIVPPLRFILSQLELFVYPRNLTITSIIRSSGVHRAGRAIDISTRNLPNRVIDETVHYFNWRYPYDLSRKRIKTILRHNVGRGDHLHVQVMENPVWYKGGLV